ncbi:glycosyl hydrolase family 95 catalytic domain-containing protein [Terrimonas pollutisoli]|uniref:glycosyl hydrolase family 95 catalytic domain-containing protein n=1 Tax=Terrimonas pollutisoli TaxID=3034147 RepID=UPI0023ED40DC|nr:glycoside hydrolase N-terminal domain-containing protein [Terrimonas sp. H1YJ31]
MQRGIFLFCVILPIAISLQAQPRKEHNLVFDSLARRWDEAIPLGNGWLGALIWQRENKLRMSLDRVDLWDDRPMPEINKLTFSWVVEQVKKSQYDTVQKLGDEPYEKYPAPTKIPGAAIEFDLAKIGKAISNELDIATGLSVIKFDNGTIFNNYIHATNPVGYFGFENITTKDFVPELVIPNYNTGKRGTSGNSVEGIGLERLGYKKGTITKTNNSILYHQPTWKENFYEVLVKWYRLPGNRIIGQWTITNNKPARLADPNFKLKEPTGWPSHIKWWKDYWSRSSVTLPDKQLDRQYYLEMYKFACVARSNTPPISLQAIWTADNGNLPPWKGDFHHDLNTQLSYWPGYAGNHLDLTAGYTSWLWKVKELNKKWTKNYFGVDGLNVPGVTTISGKEMGGWIQYSMSPTTATWLAQHFYWQWKYSMDEKFLKERCYPYLNEVERYTAEMLNKEKDKNNKAKLLLSSSPEYNDNSIKAWFDSFTNYDLALIKGFYDFGTKVSATAYDRRPNEWIGVSMTLPDLDVNETGLTIAPGQNLEVSHRHHSPYMAIYPICLLDIDYEKDKQIIERSIRHLETKGTSQWCGYSFSWMACIYARARQADKAVKQLQIFASNFCSPNSFHLNGDQRGGQYSSFTYRPFTLEGNFAFAQGIHELLLQTRNGVIEIFPSVPASWKDVSFKTLRAEGAFLVSADKENAVPSQATITAEQGGVLRLKKPFKTFYLTNLKKSYKLENEILEIEMKKGETITIKNGYE